MQRTAHLHEAVAHPTARAPFASAQAGAHSRSCLLSVDCRLVRRAGSPRTEREVVEIPNRYEPLLIYWWPDRDRTDDLFHAMVSQKKC
jgi:hypothetical protein